MENFLMLNVNWFFDKEIQHPALKLIASPKPC